MGGDFVDEYGVEDRQTFGEGTGPRCIPEQVVQSSGAVEISDFDDERPAEFIRWRLLIAKTFGEGGESRLDLVEVSFGQADEQRILVWEVLIERSNRDISPFGDMVGRRVVVSERFENTSSLVEDATDEFTGPLLPGPFAGFDRSSEMRVVRHEQYSRDLFHEDNHRVNDSRRTR